ncbi:MAG: acyltransferase [Ignavibacteriae bacterium]|nr:acyltransferase [Ignavibacteriota bacterium]
MRLTIALAQIDPVLGNVARNIETHLAMCDKAIASGASLVVFPELSLTGYSIKDMNWDLAINPSRNSGLLKPLLEKSRQITILAGGVEESSSFALFNSAFMFEEGTVRVVHRKTYPPTYGMFEEMRYFSSGRSVKAFEAKVGKIGVLICEDLWHISLPYLLAKDGALIVIALVASPTRMSGNETQLQTATINTENHRAYARLLTTYIAFCNRVGYEDGVNFWGGSNIVGPDGELLVQAKLFEEDLITAEVDANEVRRARRFSRHFLDEEVDLVLAELSRIRQNRS